MIRVEYENWNESEKSQLSQAEDNEMYITVSSEILYLHLKLIIIQNCL